MSIRYHRSISLIQQSPFYRLKPEFKPNTCKPEENFKMLLLSLNLKNCVKPSKKVVTTIKIIAKVTAIAYWR
jgi:hypothetical protein